MSDEPIQLFFFFLIWMHSLLAIIIPKRLDQYQSFGDLKLHLLEFFDLDSKKLKFVLEKVKILSDKHWKPSSKNMLRVSFSISFLNHSALCIIISEWLDQFSHTLYQQLRSFNLFYLHTWKLSLQKKPSYCLWKSVNFYLRRTVLAFKMLLGSGLLYDQGKHQTRHLNHLN